MRWQNTAAGVKPSIALAGLGERLRREDLLSEALQDVRQAQAVYVNAGLKQYDDKDFATLIAALEAALSAMGKEWHGPVR